MEKKSKNLKIIWDQVTSQNRLSAVHTIGPLRIKELNLRKASRIGCMFNQNEPLIKRTSSNSKLESLF